MNGETANSKSSDSKRNNMISIIYCALLSLPPAIWIFMDNSVWSWDQSFYGSATMDLWFSLVNYPEEFIAFLLNSIQGAKTPGIALFGMMFLPLGLILKSVDSCLLLSILVTAYFSLLLTFKTSEALARDNKYIPFLTTLMLASCPLFSYLSRVYLVEMQQLLPVVYMYWILATFKKREVHASFAHFMFATAISLFSKVSSPLYCLIPGIVLAVKFLRSDLKKIIPEKPRALAVWILSLMALILVSVWYLKNFGNAMAAAKELSIGGIAENYGVKTDFISKLIIWLRITAERTLITPVLWLLPVMLGLPVYQFFKQKDSIKEKFSTIDENSIVGYTALAQTLLVFFVLSNSIPEDSRYGFAVFPSIIFLFQIVVTQVKASFFYIAMIIAFAIQFTLINLEYFGIGSILGYGVERVLIKDQATLASEIRAIVKTSAYYYKRGYSIVIGASYPWINANTYSYFYQKDRFKGDLKIDKLAFKAWDVRSTEAEGLAFLRKRDKYIFITHTLDRLKRETMLPHANLLNFRLYQEASKGEKLDFPSKLEFVLFRVDRDEINRKSKTKSQDSTAKSNKRSKIAVQEKHRQ